jgi:protein TonB
VSESPRGGFTGRRGSARALLFFFFALVFISSALAEDARKLKTGNQPEYPELARGNNITGSARLQIVVAPDGTVKDIKVLGGNAVLVEAAVKAVKKWKYEPATADTTIVLKFDFKP